jgi:phosphohistidine phosphatase
MDLYILRHADAWPLGEQGIRTDEERFLTKRGEQQARRAGQALVQLGVHPRLVWSSPWLRARQSAELLMRAWPNLPALHLMPDLVPPGDLPALLLAIRQEKCSSLVLVGHEPFLGQLLGHLISPHHDLTIPLGKGNLAAVTWDPRQGKGELQWLLGRKIMRRLTKHG